MKANATKGHVLCCKEKESQEKESLNLMAIE